MAALPGASALVLLVALCAMCGAADTPQDTSPMPLTMPTTIEANSYVTRRLMNLIVASHPVPLMRPVRHPSQPLVVHVIASLYEIVDIVSDRTHLSHAVLAGPAQQSRHNLGLL